MSEPDKQPNPLTKYPYLAEFIMHYRLNNQALLTATTYESKMRHFFDWMLAGYGRTDVTSIDKKMIFAFRDYCRVHGYAVATTKLHLAVLGQFIGYLIAQEVILEENDPWPRRLGIKGESNKLPKLVLAPNEVFRLRVESNVRLEAAWFFELGLSSGMRRSEIMQLVPADFNFDDRPFDQELHRPSPYFVGSIMLKPTLMTLKRRRPRKVYFSYLSGMLTKQFFAKHGLDPNDRQTCIFPWTGSAGGSWLHALGKNIIEKFNSATAGMAVAPEDLLRDKYYTHINPDDLPVSAKFKKMMHRRRQEGANLESYKREPLRQTKQHRRLLHPHALRHTFTPLMYYRNPLGERQADSTLRILLGHQSYDTTFIYLRDLPLITSDTTWKQLWLGKPQDWNGINR